MLKEQDTRRKLNIETAYCICKYYKLVTMKAQQGQAPVVVVAHDGDEKAVGPKLKLLGLGTVQLNTGKV